MSTTAVSEPDQTVEELSEALATVFRTADVGDVFTDDVFLDGHPPFWRFQLEGLETFDAWLRDYAAHRPEVSVVRTIPTADGFLTEQTSREQIEGRGEITSRKVLICTVRDGRISELCVYCSGDFDAELRARHAAEAPILRPS
jgi:hypothetical protein